MCKSKNKQNASFCYKCGTERREKHDKYDAFISYRRDGGSDAASVIQLELEKFGKIVFLDVAELQVGRFDEKLLEVIENSDAFILLLSENSLDRCANKSDWLKREIVFAIEKNKKIIPVILPGFSYPEAKMLGLFPDSMSILPKLYSVQYSHINRNAFIRKIVEAMAAEQKPLKITPNEISPKTNLNSPIPLKTPEILKKNLQKTENKTPDRNDIKDITQGIQKSTQIEQIQTPKPLSIHTAFLEKQTEIPKISVSKVVPKINKEIIGEVVLAVQNKLPGENGGGSTIKEILNEKRKVVLHEIGDVTITRLQSHSGGSIADSPNVTQKNSTNKTPEIGDAIISAYTGRYHV